MIRDSDTPRINTASKEELMRAPGIDNDVADEVIRNRPYQSAADLNRLALIGERRIEQLRESLTIP
jgi:DNA uptake protein ComE-like DNA-binding protein